MEKKYELNGYSIAVYFHDGIVKIEEADALKGYLSKDIEARSIELVNMIKSDYSLLLKKDLQISNGSMMIEIWGHALASRFAQILGSRIKVKFVQDFAQMIFKRSNVIDCGERKKDPNRLVWDILSNFKSLFLLMAPKNVKQPTKKEI